MITSYTINVTVDDTGLNVECINGQNLTYYITIPGNQTYIILKDMLLSKFVKIKFKKMHIFSHSTPYVIYVSCIGQHN